MKKTLKEFPVNLIWVHFLRKSFVFIYKEILFIIFGEFGKFVALLATVARLSTVPAPTTPFGVRFL